MTTRSTFALPVKWGTSNLPPLITSTSGPAIRCVKPLRGLGFGGTPQTPKPADQPAPFLSPTCDAAAVASFVHFTQNVASKGRFRGIVQHLRTLASHTGCVFFASTRWTPQHPPPFSAFLLLPMSAIWLTLNAGGLYRGFPPLAALQIVQYNFLRSSSFKLGLHPLIDGECVKGGHSLVIGRSFIRKLSAPKSQGHYAHSLTFRGCALFFQNRPLKSFQNLPIELPSKPDMHGCPLSDSRGSARFHHSREGVEREATQS